MVCLFFWVWRSARSLSAALPSPLHDVQWPVCFALAAAQRGPRCSLGRARGAAAPVLQRREGADPVGLMTGHFTPSLRPIPRERRGLSSQWCGGPRDRILPHSSRFFRRSAQQSALSQSAAQSSTMLCRHSDSHTPPQYRASSAQPPDGAGSASLPCRCFGVPLPTATQAGGRRHATTWVIDTRAHDAAGAADACAHLGSGCLTAKHLPSNCLG